MFRCTGFSGQLNRKTRRTAQPRLAVRPLEERLAPAVYDVTNLGDSGLNTLRYAINGANISLGADTVSIDVTGLITLTTGSLNITDAVSIVGPGANLLTIKNGGTDRIFNTSGAPAGAAINISGVTITGGLPNGPGGGIFVNDEALTLTSCVVSGNTSQGDGGGICVQGPGSLTLGNSTIGVNTANGANSDGGGIALETAASVAVSQCLISGNLATHNGGGVYFDQNGSLTMDSSAIVNNTCNSKDGGGLYFFGIAFSGTITNTTITGNTSVVGAGGGISVEGSASIALKNSTLAFNTAATNGGGVAVVAGTLTLDSTIVAKDTCAGSPDIKGAVTANKSFIGSLTGATVAGTPLTGDPLLNLLAFNGGPTPSLMPAVNSPVIDKGSNVASLAFDQRGVSRSIGAGPDIGAVEVSSSLFVTNTLDNGAGSLRRAVQDANIDSSLDTITFDSVTFATPKTIDVIGEISITDSVTINGPGNVTLNAVGVGRVFNIDGPGTLKVNLSGMTLFNAKITSGNGGAIRIADENVTLSQITIMNCQATGGNGGAIAGDAAGAVVSIFDSLIENNAATSQFGNGGAIVFEHAGTLTLQRSRITGNTSNEDGGGISFLQGGSLNMGYSTLDHNLSNAYWAGYGGGALYFVGTVGAGGFKIVDTTISSNTAAAGNGGGIEFQGSLNNLNICNNTITGNIASGKGGGFDAKCVAGKLSITSCIVAGNSAPTGPDFTSDIEIDATACAIGSKTGIATFVPDGTTSSLLGANLKLGPLADNGGAMPTHLPAPDSPVVGNGTNPLALALDQRGTGFGRVRSGSVDIGAVEAFTPFVVTNTSDSGSGSLRQAVVDANAFIGPDTITFSPAFSFGGNTITLTTGNMAVSDALAIVGPGTAHATVSGNNLDRIFNLRSAPPNAPITISGMSFTAGRAVDDGGAFLYGNSGGAILAGSQHLTLNQCVFTGNLATSGFGGAVAVLYGGSLSATDCTFNSNVAQHSGGALADFNASANISLVRCTVSGNQANSAGGIYAYRYLTLDSSTISGNQATGIFGNGYGGGIVVGSAGTGATTFTNSTISGNKAQSKGGGIYDRTTGSLTIQNCTIVANTTATNGGGLARKYNSPTTIVSSAIAQNAGAASPDISSPGAVTANFSAIGNADGFTLEGGNNLPFGANLKLSALANNGGPTQTLRPAADSPLVDAGSNPANLSTDQRGVSRTLGVRPDIGAVESANSLVVTNNSGAGPGSLRQCVSDADIDAGPNTVTFDPGFFGSPQEIRTNGSEIDITDAVTIVGPGSSLVSVNAYGASRVFNVDVPGSGSAVNVSGMSITGGTAAGLGGGLLIGDESVTLTDCIITGNSAAAGGGIGLGNATLTLDHCTVANNAALMSHGGGLTAQGTANVIVQNSTFSGNFSYFAGGGIDMYGGGSLLVSCSTISGNKSFVSNGGGLYFGGSIGAGGFVIRNSTFSGNTAASAGGGIAIFANSGTATVQNSTFTANTATGGGIAELTVGNILALTSCIISGNTTNVSGPDLYSLGTVNANTCLIGSLAGVTTFNPDAITTLNLGKNPMLGSFAFNGGPTKTYSLLPGSPAINNGANPAFQSTDQRGSGFVRVFGGAPDIGAFEVQSSAKITSVIVNGGAAQRSRVTTIDVTFDSPIALAAGAFQLLRQSDGATVALNTILNGNTATLTFIGGAVNGDSLADGRYTLTAVANSINSGNFDGNGDGAPGDDYTLVGMPANGLFRHFGDVDGNGTINAADFLAFRLAFLQPSSVFDFDNNGQVDAGDFLQFRLRFLQSI